MAQGNYTAKVSRDVARTKELMLAVHRESVQRTIEIMQEPVASGGNMPVDTGFLRASLQAGVGDVNFSLQANPSTDGAYSYDSGAVVLVIASASLSDTITAVYTAVYAKVANYGGDNRAPRLFVDLAAQRWPQTVAGVAAELKARMSA